LYFGICRQFLIEHTEENHLLKNESTSSATDGREMMYEKMGVKEATDGELESIPF
jgi:hypothetical protein